MYRLNATRAAQCFNVYYLYFYVKIVQTYVLSLQICKSSKGVYYLYIKGQIVQSTLNTICTS